MKTINSVLQYYKIDTKNPFYGDEVLKYITDPEDIKFVINNLPTSGTTKTN